MESFKTHLSANNTKLALAELDKAISSCGDDQKQQALVADQFGDALSTIIGPKPGIAFAVAKAALAKHPMLITDDMGSIFTNEIKARKHDPFEIAEIVSLIKGHCLSRPALLNDLIEACFGSAEEKRLGSFSAIGIRPLIASALDLITSSNDPNIIESDDKFIDRTTNILIKLFDSSENGVRVIAAMKAVDDFDREVWEIPGLINNPSKPIFADIIGERGGKIYCFFKPLYKEHSPLYAVRHIDPGKTTYIAGCFKGNRLAGDSRSVSEPKRKGSMLPQNYKKFFEEADARLLGDNAPKMEDVMRQRIEEYVQEVRRAKFGGALNSRPSCVGSLPKAPTTNQNILGS